jgi:HSP20 family protein
MAKQVKKEKKGKEIETVTPAKALSPWEEMDRFFDDVMSRGWMWPFRMDMPAWDDLMKPLAGKAPRVDVINRENEVLVRAEIPGMEKKDLEVSMTNNTVTIKGETRHEEKKEEGDYVRREISSGSFCRTVTLPGDVDGTKAKAAFKDGVLELTVPKVAKSKSRNIEVK